MEEKFDNSMKVGILGGGQLGRMLIQAAIDLDLEIHVLDPDLHAPCKSLSQKFTRGSFKEFTSVFSFGLPLDVITIEIEDVNVEALRQLRDIGKKVYPQPEVIALIQDKRTQKEFYKAHGIPTADFVITEDHGHAIQFYEFLPAFHKLARGGYDGKGVKAMHDVDDLDYAFDEPAMLEKMVDVDKEISVIVARNEDGDLSTFPVVEMVFDPVHNLVDYLISPAQISSEQAEEASRIAKKVAESVGLVGILAVEMFIDKTGEILVNEIAPRPHNSGHHTIKANATSQFEQHWRAILGLPLGSTKSHKLSAMVNILGADGYQGDALYVGLHKLLEKEDIHVHLYGKKTTKPARKMGHVTIMDDNLESLKEKVKFVKETLKVIA
jgi:5-(carboxyamino)imidazole ribonucleotide synthase